jgi:hypothetical protein
MFHKLALQSATVNGEILHISTAAGLCSMHCRQALRNRVHTILWRANHTAAQKHHPNQASPPNPSSGYYGFLQRSGAAAGDRLNMSTSSTSVHFTVILENCAAQDLTSGCVAGKGKQSDASIGSCQRDKDQGWQYYLRLLSPGSLRPSVPHRLRLAES